MRIKSILVLIIVLSSTSYTKGDDWTIFDKPGARETYITGISGSNLVGTYLTSTYHGFLYHGETWTTLDKPGANNTHINGISGSNIVGYYNNGPSDYTPHGFIYNLLSGTWTTLDYPGASNTWIYGISGSNLVGEKNGASYDHGFIYDGTNWTTLVKPAASWTVIFGIDGDNLVGIYGDGTGLHGFLYNGTSWTTLDMPGVYETYIRGISGNNIVGSFSYAMDTDNDGIIDGGQDGGGFIYDGISWVTLRIADSNSTFILGIDENNIVGTYGDQSGWHGFLYTIPVSEPAQAPIADADGPYTIYVGGTLTLDASGSTDDDNDIVSYLWDLDDNNNFETDAGNQPVFDVNFAELQSIGLLVGNSYNIHLKVTDSGGLSNVANTTLTIIPTPALLVIVDIKPGSCPNPLNVKSSGVLPVAILGTADFDITTIDATSIRLAGVSPLRSSVEDVGGPVIDSNDCNCTEDGPDGLADLTLKFKTRDIVEAIGDVNYGDVLTLQLAGVLTGERPIEGADCVVIGGKHKPFNKFDVNKDGVVDSRDFAIFAENWLQSSIVED